MQHSNLASDGIAHRPPKSPLFPYTTLFRSLWPLQRQVAEQLVITNGMRLALRIPLVETPQVDAQNRTLDLVGRSEEHTSELQSLTKLVCGLLLHMKDDSYT